MGTYVTLDLMRHYLERLGWRRYKAVEEPTEKEGIIYTGWRSLPKEEGFTLTIDPVVERNYLSFRVPKILTAPLDTTPIWRINDLMVAMSFINYRIILGKFAYDARDGEVCFSIDIPIDENIVTYEQFKHCLDVAVKTVEEYAPKLRAIANGEKSAVDFIAEELKSENELLKLLMGFLEELKRWYRGR